MDEKQIETKLALPAGFLLGAASSAHQVEGENYHSDWWHFEQLGKLPKSGKAADHYNRFDEDFAMAKDMGLNAMRISIEWSRIEPVEGQWDRIAIEHYRKVLLKLRELGLTRVVTLHHFTLPQWLAEKGGFETFHGTEAFARFAWFVASNLGDEIDYWVTINEPEIFSGLGFNRGIWPPFKKNLVLMLRVYHNLMEAHKAAYGAIKKAKPGAVIGLAKNNVSYEPSRRNNFWDRFAAAAYNYFGNEYFLNRIQNQLDFIGLNYYFSHDIKLTWTGPKVTNRDWPKSDMGWQTYPRGLYLLLSRLKKYRKPVLVTENGIANARDDMRQDFIREHLQSVSRAIAEGANVKGYFYWSLTDTYEWEHGFDPKFGLVEVNFETQERRVRDSAKIFKDI
jgi:beta-glucosidase